jgi:uncharacterized membrane protein YbjE (DUF340 family)
MTKNIVVVLVVGILSGIFVLPDCVYGWTDSVLDIGLCCLLFFVGIDIGRNREIFNKLKNVGVRILIVPGATAVGSLFGGIICAMIFHMDIFGALAVAAGFTWYSLSAIIITPVSAKLGAIAFLSNVFREILSFIMIPFIAKHIGYLETIAVGGAISMDTGLPIITQNTGEEIVIISFISGVIISLLVTILVPIFVGLI